ncbi:MAG: methylmalonyl-CoA mutase, partial [Candidatus Heimdallarchaeota archaeon]
MSEKKIRVLMSKPGIDGHWRGGIVVSRAIRDAGMELIFGGFQNVEQIVESAIQEDVDVIGLSIHSGAHFAYTQQVIDLLKERGVLDNFMILVGGIVPA